jgi:hypothetical protein
VVKPNRKGADFERRTAKILSLWLSYGKDDSLFVRSQGSGSQFTRARKGQIGDLGSVSVLGSRFLEKYFVECKHHRNLDLLDLLLGNSSSFLRGVIRKCRDQAQKSGKEYMLIAKENFREEILIVDPETARHASLSVPPSVPSDSLIFHDLFALSKDSVCLIPLRRFVEAVDPRLFLGEEPVKRVEIPKLRLS